jgi:hypothetical protein
MEPLQLIRDVETRWSSVYLMITRAITLRAVWFKVIQYFLRLNLSKGIDRVFRELEGVVRLSNSDWKKLEMMKEILEVGIYFSFLVEY